MKNKTLEAAIQILPEGLTHVLEFGVYQGRSIRALRENLPAKYKLFGFDSFEGLPEHWTGTKTTPEQFSTQGRVPEIDGVKFYKGWFEDTIPQYLKVARPIALLHVDCDLYSSTVTVLESLKKYIVPGTVIVFDEWYYNHKDIPENRQHEQKAFYEWVEKYQLSFELLEAVEDERQLVRML